MILIYFNKRCRCMAVHNKQNSHKATYTRSYAESRSWALSKDSLKRNEYIDSVLERNTDISY